MAPYLQLSQVTPSNLSFSPQVITRPWSSAGGAVSPSGATKTCNHRRKRSPLQPDRLSRKGRSPSTNWRAGRALPPRYSGDVTPLERDVTSPLVRRFVGSFAGNGWGAVGSGGGAEFGGGGAGFGDRAARGVRCAVRGQEGSERCRDGGAAGRSVAR